MPKGVYARNAQERDWSRVEDESLKGLVGQPGMSFKAVAAEMTKLFPLTRKYTRNTVLGRAARLGLRSAVKKGGEVGVGRPPGYRHIPKKDKTVTIRKPAETYKPKSDPAPYVPGKVREDHHNFPLARLTGATKRVRITKEEIAIRRLGHVPQIIEDAPITSKPLFECGDRDCKWPTSSDIACMEVCGAPATYGAYCDRHGAVAYRLAPTKKRNAILHKEQTEHTIRLEHEDREPATFTPPALPEADVPPILMLSYDGPIPNGGRTLCGNDETTYEDWGLNPKDEEAA